jgi:hypothetical protein
MAAEAHPHAHSHADPPDTLGQVLSAICMVHCVSTPLVLALLPAAGSVLGGVHPVLFVGVVAVALWAMVPGYRAHHSGQPLGLAAAGISMLGLALLFHDVTALDLGFSVVGAALMMGAHWRNRVLLAQHCTHPHAH